MIVKRLNENNQDKRNFDIVEICCARMGRELELCTYWNAFHDEIWASDGEESIGGMFCCFCGQKITVKS